jgi:hypothetical protein
MSDEKARSFLDWLLSDKGSILAREALQGDGEFEEVERAARRVIGPHCNDVMIAARVIRYFEERRKLDPDPARSSTARYVPIRQFMDAFFFKHPEFHEYRGLLDYYLTQTKSWDDTIYVPGEQSPLRAKASLTGFFMAIKDGIARTVHV